MKNLFLTGLAAAALATACHPAKTADSATSAATQTDPKALGALFDGFWEKQSRLDPLSATAQGDNRYNDRLPNDGTRAYRDTLRTFYQDYLTRLEKFDRAKLGANDQLSYDVFQYQMQQNLAGLKLNTWMLPFNQFYALPLTLGQMGSGEGKIGRAHV